MYSMFDNHRTQRNRWIHKQPTMYRTLANERIPELLICVCVDGVLAVGKKIIFSHGEPVSAVAKTYSQVFETLAFLRTDLSTKELLWLAMRPYN